MSMDSLDHVVEQMREGSSKMTAEKIAEIRQQLANRGATPCARCKDSGKISVKDDSTYKPIKRWHDETCSQCGGIAIRAIGLLTELLDELESANVLDAQARTDWEKLTRERDEAQERCTAWCELASAMIAELRQEYAPGALPELAEECVEAIRKTRRERDSARAATQRAIATSAANLRSILKRLNQSQENELALTRELEVERALKPMSADRVLDLMQRYRADGSCEYEIRDIMLGNLAQSERLRKAETDRDKFASCWAKAETALSDMEIAKNERITTLEAALEEARKAISAGLPFMSTDAESTSHDYERYYFALNLMNATHERIGRLTPEKP